MSSEKGQRKGRREGEYPCEMAGGGLLLKKKGEDGGKCSFRSRAKDERSSLPRRMIGTEGRCRNERGVVGQGSDEGRQASCRPMEALAAFDQQMKEMKGPFGGKTFDRLGFQPVERNPREAVGSAVGLGDQVRWGSARL